TPEIPGSFQVTITADDGQQQPNSVVTSSIVFNVTGVVDGGDPVRIQAEDLVLSGGFFVEGNNPNPVEEGAIIRLGFDGSTGQAQLALTEDGLGITPGENRLEIDLFDENDGESTLVVSIQRGDQIIELGTVVLDGTGGGNNAQPESSRTIAFDGVDIQDGDILLLDGTSDNLEPLRIDALEFTPTGTSAGNFAPTVIPVFEPDDLVEIPAGQTLNLNQVFADPEEDPLTFNVTDPDGQPIPFLSVVGDLLTVAPDAPQETIDIVLTAVDATGSNITVSRPIMLEVQAPTDIPPALVAEIADVTIAEDAEFVLDVSSSFAETVDALSAPGGDSIVFTATLADGSDLPAWLSFDPMTATFTGTPLQDDIDELEVTVTATDDDGFVSDTFLITIENANDAPIAIDPSPIGEQTANINEEFSFALPAADTLFTDEDLLLVDTTEALTVAFDPATLPSGVTIDADGNLTGIPDTLGTFTVGVIATDVAGEMATSTFDIVVAPGEPPTDGAALFTANIAGGSVLGSSTFAENRSETHV
ncbi:MAG: putative Ig domain-containing protein, partial [Pseudomonadota bacterium]